MLVLLTFGLGLLSSPAVTLEWDHNVEPEAVGYRVYIGTESRLYDRTFDAGTSNSYALRGMEPGRTYYMAVTAYDADGLESDFSEEVTYTRRIDGTNTFVIPMALSYSAPGCAPAISFANDPVREFFVQASTNLLVWQTIGNVSSATNNVAVMHDEQASEFPIRFYRVISAR